MYHIIINPASRSGRGAKIWSEQIEPALKESNAVYQTYFSKKAGEVKHLAAQITAEHPDDPDLKLIILGGRSHCSGHQGRRRAGSRSQSHHSEINRQVSFDLKIRASKKEPKGSFLIL